MSTKTTQGKLWSVQPQYWSQHFEPWFMPMYRRALQQLHLTTDDLLLDAGCGSGMFSALAQRTGAQVLAIDAAPGLLEVARERNPGISFMEEDLESLPFAENTFSVVAAFNSFQYAGDFDKAVKEAKRVLKPGGRLLIGIWDKPEASEGTNILKAIGALLPPPPPGTPGPFALSEEGKMEAMLGQNGLRLAYKTTVPCPMLFASLGDAVKSFMGTGPAAAAIQHHDRQVVETAVTRAFEPYRLTEDLHYLHNQFLLFIAEK